MDRFDGRVLNPSGVEIVLPYWAFRRLKKLHLLKRDRDTGKRRICARVFGLMELWDGPEFQPYRALRALRPGGKTHLLYAQFRAMVVAGRSGCHVRTTRELIEELRKMELSSGFVSPVMAAARANAPYHLFWDDIGKLKTTDFKTEVLFELVDMLYRHKHGLTVTANHSLKELVAQERMHPAIVRRLDDMCRVISI